MDDRTHRDDLDPVCDALYEGRKIEAIKRYREVAGVGLAEAKDAVEALDASLRERSPEKFKAPAPGRGCLAMLSIGALVALAAAAGFG